MKRKKYILTEENYYSIESDKVYCSASQYLNFVGRPILAGCEAREMARLRGEYVQETTKAMLIGSILDTLWELDEMSIEEKISLIADKFPECVSSRGATKGELKTEYKQAIQLYQRTLKDELFCKFMSGEKQTIMTGEIGGLPFKIKMDSFIPGVCITDLKTTQDCSASARKYVPDSGNRETFFSGWAYDTQLAIYREIVRQNTGDLLPCYIAAIDKREHPVPRIIELNPKMLDSALEVVKMHTDRIIALKSGEEEPLRCEDCDYCRDTYKCRVIGSEEFECGEV